MLSTTASFWGERTMPSRTLGKGVGLSLERGGRLGAEALDLLERDRQRVAPVATAEVPVHRRVDGGGQVPRRPPVEPRAGARRVDARDRGLVQRALLGHLDGQLAGPARPQALDDPRDGARVLL